jgi:hypothetical protein
MSMIAMPLVYFRSSREDDPPPFLRPNRVFCVQRVVGDLHEASDLE